MGYIFWDTERIRNTKIYMLGYIVTDNSFKIQEETLIIDESIDVSHRHSPKRKVQELRSKAIVVQGFNKLYERMKAVFSERSIVCFGQTDFLALNDQLKIANEQPMLGDYYDVEHFIKTNQTGFPTNLAGIAHDLKLDHNPHNPLSDSYVTMELFKNLVERYPQESMKESIPNKETIMDIEANGSYANKANSFSH